MPIAVIKYLFSELFFNINSAYSSLLSIFFLIFLLNEFTFTLRLSLGLYTISAWSRVFHFFTNVRTFLNNFLTRADVSILRPDLKTRWIFFLLRYSLPILVKDLHTKKICKKIILWKCHTIFPNSSYFWPYNTYL